MKRKPHTKGPYYEQLCHSKLKIKAPQTWKLYKIRFKGNKEHPAQINGTTCSILESNLKLDTCEETKSSKWISANISILSSVEERKEETTRNRMKQRGRRTQQIFLPAKDSRSRQLSMNILPTVNTSVNPLAWGIRAAHPETAVAQLTMKPPSQQHSVGTDSELIKAPGPVLKEESGIKLIYRGTELSLKLSWTKPKGGDRSKRKN